ncbi:MAG: orotate phosphoribosyltransferase [Pseudomonadota bacterium]
MTGFAQFDPDAAGSAIARMLLDIGAIDIRPAEPFTLTSGLVAPCYIDCRQVISHPRGRAMAMDLACAQLVAQAGVERFDAVAGGETAGIPFAAWIAERLALPMLYVRKKPKGFGRNARIEGRFAEGARTLLVEDLTTDGGSKLNFVSALREAGAECAHTCVLFYYDIFPEVPDGLAGHGIRLHYLATWRHVLSEAKARGSFDGDALNGLSDFLDNPLSWSAAHGGKDSHALAL